MAVGLSLLFAPAAGLRRRVALWALVLGVLVAHGCVTQTLADRMIDFDKDSGALARIEVAYVREMTLSAPPATAAPAAVAGGALSVISRT